MSAVVRRYDDELRPANIKSLFSPFDIFKMSKGKYNRIEYRGQCFNIGKYNYEEMEWDTKPIPFCYAASLNTWENSKGADRGYIRYILFDEFITRRNYLVNEYISFQNCVSTFIRDRGKCNIFLVGNSVSFYCPYFNEFNVNVKDMKPGDLNCYQYENGTKIAVQYCASVGETKASAKFFNFNDKAKMITTGQWEIPEYPHYPHSVDFVRDVLFRFYVKFDNEKLCCCLINKKEGYFVFIHEQTKDIPDDAIIFSQDFSSDIRHQRGFKQLPAIPLYEKIRHYMLSAPKFFSNNKVGEIFNNYYRWQAQESTSFSS